MSKSKKKNNNYDKKNRTRKKKVKTGGSNGDGEPPLLPPRPSLCFTKVKEYLDKPKPTIDQLKDLINNCYNINTIRNTVQLFDDILQKKKEKEKEKSAINYLIEDDNINKLVQAILKDVNILKKVQIILEDLKSNLKFQNININEINLDDLQNLFPESIISTIKKNEKNIDRFDFFIILFVSVALNLLSSEKNADNINFIMNNVLDLITVRGNFFGDGKISKKKIEKYILEQKQKEKQKEEKKKIEKQEKSNCSKQINKYLNNTRGGNTVEEFKELIIDCNRLNSDISETIKKILNESKKMFDKDASKYLKNNLENFKDFIIKDDNCIRIAKTLLNFKISNDEDVKEKITEMFTTSSVVENLQKLQTFQFFKVLCIVGILNLLEDKDYKALVKNYKNKDKVHKSDIISYLQVSLQGYEKPMLFYYMFHNIIKYKMIIRTEITGGISTTKRLAGPYSLYETYKDVDGDKLTSVTNDYKNNPPTLLLGHYPDENISVTDKLFINIFDENFVRLYYYLFTKTYDYFNIKKYSEIEQVLTAYENNNYTLKGIFLNSNLKKKYFYGKEGDLHPIDFLFKIKSLNSDEYKSSDYLDLLLFIKDYKPDKNEVGDSDIAFKIYLSKYLREKKIKKPVSEFLQIPKSKNENIENNDFVDRKSVV